MVSRNPYSKVLKHSERDLFVCSFFFCSVKTINTKKNWESGINALMPEGEKIWVCQLIAKGGQDLPPWLE
jgi:hypothetical protein